MPTYMDVHDLPGVTPEAVAKAHLADLKVQAKHGVEYVKYWLNEKQGKVFCLCHAPSAEAAAAVHREAHGLEAARIMEVDPDLTGAFMGAAEIDTAGAVLLPNSSLHDPATRTVFFTDIVGSTDITQSVGDDLAMTIVEAHDRIVRAALEATSGREIKHMGDGIMAAFVSAHAAVRCAITVQQEVGKHRSEIPEHALRVRIGMAAGEPIERNSDFYGSTVQLAARLCAHASPAQTLVSNVVAELCLGKAAPLKDLGLLTMKGFPQPVHVHAIMA